MTSTRSPVVLQSPTSCTIKRRQRGMLIAVWLLMLMLVDGSFGAPRAWSSSNREEEVTRGDDVITDTESGRVRGSRHNAPYLRRPVDAYLGIPFAKPPLNSLRFRPPQPIEKWRYVYNASQRLPNSCYQLHDRVFGTDFHVRNYLFDLFCTYITLYNLFAQHEFCNFQHILLK